MVSPKASCGQANAQALVVAPVLLKYFNCDPAVSCGRCCREAVAGFCVQCRCQYERQVTLCTVNPKVSCGQTAQASKKKPACACNVKYTRQALLHQFVQCVLSRLGYCVGLQVPLRFFAMAFGRLLDTFWMAFGCLLDPGTSFEL